MDGVSDEFVPLMCIFGSKKEKVSDSIEYILIYQIFILLPDVI
jgi:hypothetical protein